MPGNVQVCSLIVSITEDAIQPVHQLIGLGVGTCFGE
jgi:hypothetical protein